MSTSRRSPPAFPNPELVEMHRRMVVIRGSEQRVAGLYRDGEVPGFVHLSIGQEAAAVGACWPLRPTDVITSTHRGHGHCLAKGLDPLGMFAELMGRDQGTNRGRGGSMHIADPKLGIFGANGIVAAGVPIAAGAAAAAQLRADGGVAVAFFGDGAPAQGAFHEAVNLAAVWRLPVVFFCENNGYAEFSPVSTQHATSLERRAAGYGVDPAAFDPRTWLDAEIRYLHTMSEGMAGMVHASDVRVAEGLRDIELPAEPGPAMETWNRTFNDAVVGWHRAEGHVLSDLNELEAQGLNEPMGYCFPHVFVLPMYSSASSYRFRPLGPEETLMEIWSLTRFPEDYEPPKPTPPEPWDCDDPRVPPIPTQDFSNLPRQQRGLHAKGFEYMRFSEQAEGGIINFERTVDGFLAGLPYETLLPALGEVNVNPLERPVADLGF